jgi:hypothetical protein
MTFVSGTNIWLARKANASPRMNRKNVISNLPKKVNILSKPFIYKTL